MISDPHVADELFQRLLEAGRILDESVALVKQSCPADELEEYRRAVGRVLGELHLEVLKKLIEDHPELEPDSWKGE